MSSEISHRIPLTVRLQPLRMRRITALCIGANFSRIFEIPDPDLPIHYYNFYGATIKTNGVIRQNNV